MQSPNSPATVAALVDALCCNPFYFAITAGFGNDVSARRLALARYFDYSMSEGGRLGRLLVWPDPAVAAAVWLLPVSKSLRDAEAKAKDEFLATALGTAGSEAYRRIVEYMHPRAIAVVAESAWYLSIVGVAPSAQSQGIGKRLIGATLAEVDEAGVDCYLETFDRRNPAFYERLGFRAIASHAEPVTGSSYTIMLRKPGTRPARP